MNKMPKTRSSTLEGPFVAIRPAVSRRRFLRATGILMSLPFLDAMRPAFGALSNAAQTPGGKPRRMLGICNNLGLLPENFFPKTANVI